jgi:hypothetical protein
VGENLEINVKMGYFEDFEEELVAIFGGVLETIGFKIKYFYVFLVLDKQLVDEL